MVLGFIFIKMSPCWLAPLLLSVHAILGYRSTLFILVIRQLQYRKKPCKITVQYGGALDVYMWWCLYELFVTKMKIGFSSQIETN